MRSVHWAAIGVSGLLAGAGACTNFGAGDSSTTPGGADGGSSLDAAPEALPPVQGGAPISLSVSGPPRVLAGEGLLVMLSVSREGPDAFGGPVHVELASTPDITTPAIDIPAGKSTATVTVTVASTRRHGRIPLLFSATSPGAPSKGSASYTLLVRGPVGALDTGFGVGGVVSLGQASDASGLVVDAGKITLGGRIGGDLAVVRLNEDGALDVNYAVGGILRTNVGTLLSTQEMITSFGGLVLGATIDSGTTPRAILVAITPTGALKTNFGLSGIAPVPLVLGTTLAASPLLGRFLVGGRTTLTSPNGSVVLLKDDGSPLTTFGSNGVLEGPNDCPGVNKSDCFTRAVTVDKSNFYVCAFRHDGSLVSESSVGGGSTLFGTVYTSLSIDTCTSLAVDAAGQKIYVGGDWVGAAAVSRYKPDGSLDDTWAMGSVAGAPAGSNLTQARRIMLQADGSLIVASNATVGGLGAFAVWRLLPDGSTDKSFAPPSGFATKTVASTNVVVKAMAVDADGRIVIAGGNGEMVVTRFWQ